MLPFVWCFNILPLQKEEEIEDDEGEEVLKKDYAFDENVPKSWYKHRAIDRHKVNMKFFDMSLG